MNDREKSTNKKEQTAAVSLVFEMAIKKFPVQNDSIEHFHPTYKHCEIFSDEQIIQCPDENVLSTPYSIRAGIPQDSCHSPFFSPSILITCHLS